ncbi:MAG: hypothetical protein HC771_21980 [Synechococcales cyanobacterium CRU_2_2]|nr:hypothetical protein [Synechococcales cyanobacterium CRU_2_2]
MMSEQLIEEVARLATLVEQLALEIKSLKGDRPAVRGEWLSLGQAYPLLGLKSEGALRQRIKKGLLPRYVKRTGKGCWINSGNSEAKPRYKVHLTNTIAALSCDRPRG